MCKIDVWKRESERIKVDRSGVSNISEATFDLDNEKKEGLRS